MKVVLIVAGEPVPWQRARRRGNRYFTDPKVAEFYDRIRTAWLVEGRPRLDDAPLVMRAVFVFGRRKSHLTRRGELVKDAPRFPHCDLDNCVKGAIDAVQDSRDGSRYLFSNDLQIVSLSAAKRFAEPGEEPHSELYFADELPSPTV